MDKMSITASRLKEALELRGMRQADLVRKTGIGKSAISQYLSGKVLPKQDKLYLLARALQVSEDWLLGRTGIPTNDVEGGEMMADEILERLQRIEKKLDLVLEICATSGVNMERGWVLTERCCKQLEEDFGEGASGSLRGAFQYYRKFLWTSL